MFDNLGWPKVSGGFTLIRKHEIALLRLVTAPLRRYLSGEFDTLVAKCVFMIDLNKYLSENNLLIIDR